jgi:hypothetical protein
MNTLQICDVITHWLTSPKPKDPRWPADAWETFKFACRVHGIAPSLHEKLKRADWLEAPLQDWLDRQYALNRQRIAKMHAELKAILALFAAQNIPVMPLKGSILSVNFYEDGGLRPMADLDLLVRPQDSETAKQLLAQLGYNQEVVHWKHIEFVKPGNRQVVSTEGEHPDNPRKLELHLRCRETFGGPTVDLTGLIWAYSSQGKLLGEPAIIPTPAALWLHLLVHNTYHLWQGKGRLIQLIDLARLAPYLDLSTKNLISHQNRVIDPTMLLNTIDARFTYPSLALLQKYFPNTLEASFLAEQRARVSPTFRRWVDSLDLVNTSYLNPNPEGLYFFKALKFSDGHPREVAQALRFALLPGLDEIALDHPHLAQSKFPWLAYFLLPLDWAKRLNTARKT